MSAETLSRSMLPDVPGLDYSRENLAKLELYARSLLKWNKALNLTAAYDFNRLFPELIFDSLYLARFLRDLAPDFSGVAWDLGAGAGLPGIPLRIFWQKGEYKLIEAREKRFLFMRGVLSSLSLPRTEALRGRAEALIAAAPSPPDLALSRAFMPWPALLDFCSPWLNRKSVV